MTGIPVSIIIPNYNGEQILTKTLTSVVEAAHAYIGECEIIVVDDASQDNSIKLIAENFPEVTARYTSPEVEGSILRNRGNKNTSSPFVIFLSFLTS